MILPCVCSHEGQDQLHGIGRRVFNICKKGLACRCTVCKREVPLSAQEKKDIKVAEKK
jgi:hypothetical protein